ncbi:MAG: hypothetical protein H0V25_08530 [Solirubrobacterales bacterium]|nr:hypothetical protein [Solirubrobacterales bacterium]
MPDAAGPGGEAGAAEVGAAIVEAINASDPAALAALLDEGSEVATGRSVRKGPVEIGEWAAKEFDHLVRRYAIGEWRRSDDSALGVGSVQYVWSEGGDVADSSPIAMIVSVSGDGRLDTLRVFDDIAAALGVFGD